MFIFFIKSYVDGHLDFPHSLAIIYNVAATIGVQILLQDSDFDDFGYAPRGKITESCGTSVFKIWANFHTILLSSLTIKNSY